MRMLKATVTVLACVVLSGCMTLKPDLKPSPTGLFVAKRSPLKVAVIVPPTARNLSTLTKLSTSCWDGGITVESAGYGQLFEQTLRETLSQAYEQVDLVPSVPDDASHHAILIASISQIGYRFGCGASPENYVEVTGSLNTVDSQGKEVWRSGTTVKRFDSAMPMTLSGFDQKYGEDISKAMGALVAEWVQELGRYPTRQWAKGGAGDGEEERQVRVRDKDEELVAESDVDRPPVTKRKAKKNAYAVVFGIEKYREKLPKAEFAARDAKTMGAYLTKVLGYPEENVVVRTNDLASRNDMEKYFGQWLKNNVEPGGSVFIYYSGHGAPNPKTGDAYLVPYDGDPTYVDTTAFPLKRLYESLEKLPAKEIVVVLDSCFSGAGGRSVLAKGAKPMVISVENPVIASGKTVVLAASSADQMSSSYEEKGHGLMTYFFLKGLQGYADADEDGTLNMSELYDYVKSRVEKVARKQYNNEQTPQLLGNPSLLKNGGGALIEKGGR